MAYIDRMFCPSCKKEKQVVCSAGRPTPNICDSCQQIENETKRTLYFKGLEGLSLEARIRRIEEWIYDYKPPVNIHDVRF